VFNLVAVALAVLSFGFNLTEKNNLSDYSNTFDACYRYLNQLENSFGNNAPLFSPFDDSTKVHSNLPADSLNTASSPDSLSLLHPKDSTIKISQPPVTGTDSAVITKPVVKPDEIKIESKKDTAAHQPATNLNLTKKDSLGRLIPDSLSKKGKDSLSAKDTVKIDPMTLDSTARLQYFHYQRNEVPYVTMHNKKNSKFFAQSKSFAKERKIELDSTGEYVQIREKVAGQETKVLLRMKFDDYLAMRLDARNRELWEELGYKYEIKKAEKDLGGLIKDFTDFEIPLPSVGVLSIFGTPKISLKIGGSVLIHGAWRNETTEGITASRLGNTRNEPDFKQQVQINVNGTIGDKLEIAADWNTERTFEYENQLKIKYTGYQDEIIQSIEAGNVSLQTSSLVGGGEALFGVKAAFKMGPLTLTTIASQKKGEVKEVSLSGGSSSQTFVKRAYEYSTNHFFIDDDYADPDKGIFTKYYSGAGHPYDMNYYVKDIEVWKSVTTTLKDFTRERMAVASIDLLPLENGQTKYSDQFRNRKDEAGSVETSRFVKLTYGNDYTVDYPTGVINFRTALNDEDIIAVAYKTAQGMVGEFVGTSINPADSSSYLVLKLVKPARLQPQYTRAWKRMLKNIYPIGASNVQKEGFKLDIKYVIEGQDSLSQIQGKSGTVKLLNAFGLDLVDASGGSNPDGEFDWDPSYTILPETGEIIFPKLQPFGRDFPVELNDEQKFSIIYDTTQTAARNQKEKDKFIITGKLTGSASSTFNIGYNIVENSVKVMLNGNQLTAGVDYVVDYNVGTITLRNPDAMVANANLKITYEQNDLFQLASKTLVGARGIFDFSPKTKLGFSVLNLSQQTLSDKVRIGEEPLSNSIYGIDFTTAADLPFVTKFLDNFISTKEKSSITFNGEFAYMRPDPNTKKSTVESDEGLSIAYIDDFEGSKKLIPVGVSYTSWRDISCPVGLDFLGGRTILQSMQNKARFFWYNLIPSSVRVTEIWPKKKVAQGDEFVTILDCEYRPTLPGAYNYKKSPLEYPDSSWAGMMKRLSTSNTNLIDENIEYMEFWYKPDSVYATTDSLYINLGLISEDVIPNGKLDTEDKNSNELIDEGEDTGIDGVLDAGERLYADSTLGIHQYDDDPAHDNWRLVSGSRNADDYVSANNPQGNAESIEAGKFPDTEDLKKNQNLDLLNSYYEYSVPLKADENNPYIVTSESKVQETGWNLIRIPLKDFTKKVGAPTFSNIEMIRLYIKNIPHKVHFALTEFNLVGNQWQKTINDDSLMKITVVNIEDNPNYTSPPGVFREKDRSRPDQNIEKNEQSLNMQILGLPRGQKREVFKTLYRALDVFSYKEMKLFVHGDETAEANISDFRDEYNYAAEVYYRFGSDSNNYYEYRQPVQKGWNEISIKFSDLTSKKQGRDSSRIDSVVKFPVSGKPGHFFVVKGNPSLTKISTMTIGVLNPGDKNSPDTIRGDVWINELRVIGADDSPGWAYTANTAIKLADLMNINMNISRTDPNFHRLSERFGSRIDQLSWGISADLDILKLIPTNMQGSNLKISYSHNETMSKPKYMPGSDMLVSEAANKTKEYYIARGSTEEDASAAAEALITQTQTLQVSDSWNLAGIRLMIPTDFWLIKHTFNSLTLGFNYNKTFSRNPTTADNRTWIWNANLNYSLNFDPENYFYPTDIPVFGYVLSLFTDYRNAKIYYTPQSFVADFTAKRQRSFNTSRAVGKVAATTLISRDFGTTRGCSVNWKLTEGGVLNLGTTYSVNIGSSLAFLETDQFNQQRSESQIWRDIFGGAFFGRDYQYDQNFEIRTNPRLPSLWDIDKNFTLNLGYSVKYAWSFDFRQEALGRSAGYDSRFNVQMTLKLKDLAAPLFKEESEQERINNLRQEQSGAMRGRGRAREELAAERAGQQPPVINKPVITADSLFKTLPDTLFSYMPDTLKRHALDSLKLVLADSAKKMNAPPAEEVVDSASLVPKTPIYKTAFLMLKTFTKVVFFDYDNIQISFSNDNSLKASGLYGKGNGSMNFLGLKYDPSNGPSRLFMLGLSNDVGKRVTTPGVAVSDNFSQRNNLEFKTSKPLWEGARIDLNWKVGWSLQTTTTSSVDSITGMLKVNSGTKSATGTLDRSFLSLPPTLMFSFFKSGIKRVNELFQAKGSGATTQDLSDAFVEGFETFPLLGKLPVLKEVMKYIPRPNWRVQWDGLETLPLLKSISKKVTLEHAYSSTISEGWKLNTEGTTKEIQTQRISYGFGPLVGLNITFNSLWDGNFTGSIKYNTKNDYSLGLSTQNITEAFSRDIGITAGYSKTGFEIPFFGVSLKNDFEFSFSYTYGKTSNISFDMRQFTEAGTPQEISTRTSIEPRVKYVISSKVTLSVFYKRTSQQPEGASRLPATTTNEMGLDVNISIQ